ncbi:MAG: cytochrome c nitrite reductase small subunit [Dehalococcoidia bacterium]|nr:MAG: cytochrome c nitrite reductase small subunit [Dehalococcoidia bacterium]
MSGTLRLLWPVLAIITIGAALGTGGYTFIYAKGSSYLTNDPSACANCHVMQAEYDGWIKSSHHEVAVCNDCHTPHDLAGKYTTKMKNGYRHSFAFTTGRFEEPIEIKKSSLDIVEGACRSCHGNIVEAIDGPHREGDARISCVRCHADVGHQR